MWSTGPETAAPRSAGPDVTRALAMAGVVTMNYVGYLILRGGVRGGSALADLFDPWTGPLSTRFAATFVLVAGVGTALMRTPHRRARLASRGVVLLAVGLAFDIIWRGSILPYYGLLFMLAAVIVTWPTVILAAMAVISGFGAWLTARWRLNRALAGEPVTWMEDPDRLTPHGFVIDMSFNGTHPILPWLTFFVAGILVGRLMRSGHWRGPNRLIALALGPVLWLTAELLHRALAPGGVRSAVLWSTDPFDRGILYTLSALGTALAALALIDLGVEYADGRAVGLLQTAGQVSLTVYLVHALVFNLVVDWLGWITPGTVATALWFAAVVSVAATVVAVIWARRFGRGPAEALYRAVTL